ncbi:hypothetical protein LOD99_3471 [Oopsacas minuta]|uniref:Uncharacterized protein n=1 Tax=Oopsacas minuta TaxID=111878 RepID=A0AAV7JZY4_9METZ|nr:hypothetical protein LOD99_3471 [Oopsacas minuta]
MEMNQTDKRLDIAEPGSEARKFVKEHGRKIKRRFIAVRICLTIILVVCIAAIWISLVSPLIVSYFVMPSTANLSRPFYDQLHQLFNGSNTSELMCNDNMNISNSSCPPQYIFKCPMCVPICGMWHPFGDSYFQAFRIIAISTSIIDLVFAIVGALIFIRVPGSLKFPKIIYFFLFVSIIILSICLTIANLLGPHTFFCELRNEDYDTVAASPSIWVSILGAISHYSYISFNVCFLVAAFNLFIIIYFPHWQVVRFDKPKIILAFVEFIICICLPAIFPIIHLSITRHYSFSRLPLLPFPLGDSYTPFIMALGPLMLFTGVALTLIVLSIYRVQIMKYVVYNKMISFKSYEIRHILFALQVGFTVTFVCIALSVDFANFEISNFLLYEFWSCTTLKFNPHFLTNQSLAPTECSESYKDYMSPILALFSNVTTGISAIEILVILTTKETWDSWKNSFKRVFKTLTTVSHYSVSTGHATSRN